MADSGFELQEIARLIAIVEARDLLELIYEENERRIVIRGARYRENRAAGRHASIPATSEQDTTTTEHWSPPAQSTGGEDASDVQRTVVAAPMVGVFYRASAQGAPPYVDVGDHIEVGQTIGIIEAMKVFSEVPSDHSGTVLEVRARSGQLVRTGEPLIYLVED